MPQVVRMTLIVGDKSKTAMLGPFGRKQKLSAEEYYGLLKAWRESDMADSGIDIRIDCPAEGSSDTVHVEPLGVFGFVRKFMEECWAEGLLEKK